MRGAKCHHVTKHSL